MNSQEKNIHGLKQKNHELTETKMIFKSKKIDTFIEKIKIDTTVVIYIYIFSFGENRYIIVFVYQDK
jgi:hypothetical protein